MCLKLSSYNTSNETMILIQWYIYCVCFYPYQMFQPLKQTSQVFILVFSQHYPKNSWLYFRSYIIDVIYLDFIALFFRHSLLSLFPTLLGLRLVLPFSYITSFSSIKSEWLSPENSAR